MSVDRLRSTAQATAEGLRIFVAGIPWHIGEDILRKDFEECGVVEDLFILKDQQGNSKGRAFITFQEAPAVEAALKYDNTEYGGRTIFVKLAEEKRKGDKPAAPKREKREATLLPGDEKPEGCTSLCLKGTGEAGEKEIRKFLKGCSVQSVRVVVDRVTGQSRGIAFVDFTSSEEVDKAMALNGQSLGEAAVTMRYEAPKARPRPEGCLSVAVKKLAPEATEEDVRKLFKGLKSIADVRVICDKWTKACNGLAFVEFAEVADVEAAVRRDGMAVLGKTVFVCYETKGKTTKEPPLNLEQKKKKTEAVKAPKEEGQQEDEEEGAAAAEGAVEEEGRPVKKAKKQKGKKAKETEEKEEEEAEEKEGMIEEETAAAAVKEAKKARKRDARADRRKRNRLEASGKDAEGDGAADDDGAAEEEQEEHQQEEEAPAKVGKAPRKKKARKAVQRAAAQAA